MGPNKYGTLLCGVGVAGGTWVVMWAKLTCTILYGTLRSDTIWGGRCGTVRCGGEGRESSDLALMSWARKRVYGV